MAAVSAAVNARSTDAPVTTPGPSMPMPASSRMPAASPQAPTAFQMPERLLHHDDQLDVVGSTSWSDRSTTSPASNRS